MTGSSSKFDNNGFNNKNGCARLHNLVRSVACLMIYVDLAARLYGGIHMVCRPCAQVLVAATLLNLVFFFFLIPPAEG